MHLASPKIPNELTRLILSYLDWKSVVDVSSVCKVFYNIYMEIYNTKTLLCAIRKQRPMYKLNYTLTLIPIKFSTKPIKQKRESFKPNMVDSCCSVECRYLLTLKEMRDIVDIDYEVITRFPSRDDTHGKVYRLYGGGERIRLTMRRTYFYGISTPICIDKTASVVIICAAGPDELDTYNAITDSEEVIVPAGITLIKT